jgi:hypothetical protein
MSMKFQQWDLGNRKRGEIVRVTLSGSAANVLLLDSSGLSNFKAGRSHRYAGGLVKRSPHDFAIPHSGHWYVVVHMAGLRGTTRASVSVLPGPLPEARPSIARSALAPIRQAAEEYTTADGEVAPPPEDRPYDVFVCHATEDKDAIVRPLVGALEGEGLAVWYDEGTLRIGANLRRTIDAGLIRSRFGVVVLSPAFFGHGWRQYELDGLVALEQADGRQRILPVWHNVTRADVAGYSPSLSGLLARSTSEFSVDEIAKEIAEVAHA